MYRVALPIRLELDPPKRTVFPSHLGKKNIHVMWKNCFEPPYAKREREMGGFRGLQGNGEREREREGGYDVIASEGRFFFPRSIIHVGVKYEERRHLGNAERDAADRADTASASIVNCPFLFSFVP